MFSIEILFLGLALAIDAALVSFTLGLLHTEFPKFHKTKNAFLVALVFGFFQFFMLWMGSHAGLLFSFSRYGYLFQIVVVLIFFLIAIKVIQDSFKNDEKEIKWEIIPILFLAFATSIDALASGISLGTLPQTMRIALEVGCLTAGLCFLFYFVSQLFQKIPEKWLLRFAGLIFIGLGLNSLMVVLKRGL